MSGIFEQVQKTGNKSGNSILRAFSDSGLDVMEGAIQLTEADYRKILIDLVRTGEYEEKDTLLELLKICTLRFEKTNAFTKNLWNHYQEFIHVCIIPEKMIELKKHFKYLEKVIYEIYPPNDDYELWGEWK